MHIKQGHFFQTALLLTVEKEITYDNMDMCILTEPYFVLIKDHFVGFIHSFVQDHTALELSLESAY